MPSSTVSHRVGKGITIWTRDLNSSGVRLMNSQPLTDGAAAHLTLTAPDGYSLHVSGWLMLLRDDSAEGSWEAIKWSSSRD